MSGTACEGSRSANTKEMRSWKSRDHDLHGRLCCNLSSTLRYHAYRATSSITPPAVQGHSEQLVHVSSSSGPAESPRKNVYKRKYFKV